MTTNRSIARNDTGANVYSPWYNDNFAKDHFNNKKTELAETHTDGDLEKFGEWLKRTQRRFQSLFDRLSDESKCAYQASAKHFGGYIGIKRAKISEIVARLISLSYIEASTLVEEYISWMAEDEELAPNTINRHVAALRFFVDTARRVGWVEYKLDVKGVKTQKVKDVDAFSEREFRKILRTVQRAQGKTAARNKLLVYMLAFMGLRISSVLSLDYENIDFEQRRFKVRWKGEGKNYQWRPSGPIVFDALEEWLDQRGKHSGPIFTNFDPGKKGTGRLTRRSAERIVREIGGESGTKKKLRTHAFRHFYADDNLKATNQNTRDVSGGLGHKNIKTIEEYVTKGKGDKRTRNLVEDMEQRWIRDGNVEPEDPEEEDDLEEEYEEEDEDDEEEEDIPGVVSAFDAAENPVVYERIKTGMDNVDDVLGGGLVSDSIILLGGYPGIGKSTIARQMAACICKADHSKKVLYASGEEPVEQIVEALKRIKAVHKRVKLCSERSIDTICDNAERLKADVLIVDSVSTVSVDEVKKKPGSITQVKAVGQYILDWVKGVGNKDNPEYQEGSGICTIIISHVDKKGQIAGPKTLEHYVDAVLIFEGQKRQKPRILSQEKNRFGGTTKVAMFKMTKKGLIEQELPPQYRDEFDDEDDEDEEDTGPINSFGKDEDIEDDEFEDEED